MNNDERIPNDRESVDRDIYFTEQQGFIFTYGDGSQLVVYGETESSAKKFAKEISGRNPALVVKNA